MKKIRSRRKYQEFQQKKHHKREARRKSHALRLALWKLTIGEWKMRADGLPTPDVVPAPEHFSLIHEPVKAVEHLNEIARRAEKSKIVMSDMSHVNNFSTDVLIALIAYANDGNRGNKAKILVRSPLDPELTDKYHDSGIYGDTNIRFGDGSIRPANGTIFRISDTEVKGEIAKRLITFATNHVFGTTQKLKGVYATMIECMNNTVNHATAEGDDKEVWWATVYCDTKRQIAFFNFLDSGIGILESIKLRWPDVFLRSVGLRDSPGLLRDVLKGKIGSRTGLSYRGNGLPEIYKRFKRGQMSRLIIVSNDVYADLEKDEYRLLPKPFRGTFFHWEISYDKHFDRRGRPN
ncbi:MAG: hypothetical protein ABI539_08415 [Acidobacteriota bacterium]